ncbi:bifunctional UDP-N-acetylglucosamine diphosphorylase/glucosamine-1-phosphate N-acetyltransferase GlmU [Craterilacuibacter sp. RT1T]|uniref:bifunctional UDP-N-acetylglucosamine diphosphorylase/glucosamine-1-phosphate N-acetyltransferase GlmU n=1 Tax=Craterilacuibacter sp. RT1T TaxID=2942211 RepID=UPI0020C16C68|nr:bifunctional UDP-N-acetylglucosamine diphosphorylase/glucosamine-1-phosphate N-acetyltransferase GlmU [Craterilacuibacter sp. RT1T]MCL6264529.1 bifunctional UDP-N-acetylglucosamine diphosphorylase/glucosamine-1-phosphate N-acetyltransferase GlmU [Craterilacuibacter sp. RT1T]
MNRLSVAILAAGKGKRMYSRLPKVLHKIGGAPMLSRVVATARTLKPAKLVIVYGHGGEQVRETLRDTDLGWALQAEQLGTGHALKMALSELPADGHTLVLYGDVPLTRADTLSELVALAGDEVALLTDTLANPSGYGRIVRGSDGAIAAIVEDKDCSAEQRAITEINTGMLVLPNKHLARWLEELKNGNAQGEYYLTDVIALAVRDGVRVHGMKVADSWQAAGVNNKVQLAELERILQLNQAHELLVNGVGLADPARIDIRGTLSHGQDVLIDVGCVFEGEVSLGEGVEVGAYCVLKNVKVAAGSKIAPYSHLEDAVVGEACRIGPYARLRPGAELAAHVHVGNFVEIKKSVVGEGSKVNHLTYIGDTDIGSLVNVGAGTVTCNYDGVNKFRTVIGDNVFVGSGSMLVAPVTLEAGATIAAGSVISKTAPAGQLTVARARQTSIPGWSRPQKKA